jgi:hypothetical protein
MREIESAVQFRPQPPFLFFGSAFSSVPPFLLRNNAAFSQNAATNFVPRALPKILRKIRYANRIYSVGRGHNGQAHGEYDRKNRNQNADGTGR